MNVQKEGKIMKKLLLCTLSLFAFVGLTACGSEKKLTAEEAKTELKSVAENTAKAANDGIQGNIKLGFSANGQINNLKGYKVIGDQKTAIFTVNQAKADAKANISLNTATDFDNKIIKLGAKADAKVTASADVAGMDKMSINYAADAKADVYLKGDGKYVDEEESETLEGSNAFIDYSANLNEDLAKQFNLESKYEGRLNLFLEGMDVVLPKDEDIKMDEFITSLDEFINDWTIFKKKGNKIIADCSDLKAFKIDGEAIAVQEQLKKYGLTLSVSKFELTVDKEQKLTAFDFQLGLKGKVDFEKLELGKEDFANIAESLEGVIGSASSALGQLDAISGTLSVDLKLNLNASIKYSSSTLTVPEDLAKIEQQTISDFMKSKKAPVLD